MDTILWNQDSADWTSGQSGGNSIEEIERNIQQWLTGPKTPGLIILEHEITPQQVQIFIDSYPYMKSNGWNLVSVARLGPTGSAYQNANGTVGPVTSDDVVLGSSSRSTSTSSSSVPTSTSALLVATPTVTQSSNGAMVPPHDPTLRWGSLITAFFLFAGVGLIP